MMGTWDDVGMGLLGGGSGAATGAIMGSAFGPIGTGIGAGAGFLLGGLAGAFGNKSRRNAADAQRRALDQAMARLQQFGQQQYANRMADLDKTLAFYKPAEDALNRLYGAPLPNVGGPDAYMAAYGSPPSKPPGPQQPPVDPFMSAGAPNKGRLF